MSIKPGILKLPEIAHRSASTDSRAPVLVTIKKREKKKKKVCINQNMCEICSVIHHFAFDEYYGTIRAACL